MIVIDPRQLDTRTQQSNTLKERQISHMLSLAPETKKLISDLEQLTLDERRAGLMLGPEAFSWKVKEEIDCMGCSSRLQCYAKELAEISQSKGKSLNFDGLLILPDARISEHTTNMIHD